MTVVSSVDRDNATQSSNAKHLVVAFFCEFVFLSHHFYLFKLSFFGHKDNQSAGAALLQEKVEGTGSA